MNISFRGEKLSNTTLPLLIMSCIHGTLKLLFLMFLQNKNSPKLGIKRSCFIQNSSSIFKFFNLPLYFIVYCFCQESYAIDILHFSPHSIRLSRVMHRNIGIHSQLTLCHDCVAAPKRLKNELKLSDCCSCFFPTAHISLHDNLHEADSSPIQVDKGLAPCVIMETLPTVLLQLNLFNPHSFGYHLAHFVVCAETV